MWLKGPTCSKCYGRHRRLRDAEKIKLNQARYYAKHKLTPEQRKEYATIMNRKQRESYKRNGVTLAKRMYSGQKSAKRRNIIWLLTKEEYEKISNNPCHYCNNLLGKNTLTSWGLDRKDNSIGYTVDNCVSCCVFCNTVKMNLLTHDEMIKVAQLLINERKVILKGSPNL